MGLKPRFPLVSLVFSLSKSRNAECQNFNAESTLGLVYNLVPTYSVTTEIEPKELGGLNDGLNDGLILQIKNFEERRIWRMVKIFKLILNYFKLIQLEK